MSLIWAPRRKDLGRSCKGTLSPWLTLTTQSLFRANPSEVATSPTSSCAKIDAPITGRRPHIRLRSQGIRKYVCQLRSLTDPGPQYMTLESAVKPGKLAAGSITGSTDTAVQQVRGTLAAGIPQQVHATNDGVNRHWYKLKNKTNYLSVFVEALRQTAGAIGT